MVVLGYNYWQTQFGGDPNVLGQSIRIEGAPFHRHRSRGIPVPGFSPRIPGKRLFSDYSGSEPDAGGSACCPNIVLGLCFCSAHAWDDYGEGTKAVERGLAQAPRRIPADVYPGATADRDAERGAVGSSSREMFAARRAVNVIATRSCRKKKVLKLELNSIL